jgi:transporter family protein
MEWFLFALLAPILWAMNNVIDKIIFNRYVKNPFSYQVIIQVTNIPVVIAFLFFVNISTDIFSLVGILYGGILAITFVLYNKVLMKEEASRVMALFYINPIFILLLAVMFLGESLSISKYLGIILLVLSAILVSYKRVKGKMKLSFYAIELILIFSFIWASGQVLSKWVFNFTNYLSFLFWTIIGAVIAGFSFLISKNIRKDFLADVKRMGKIGWGLRIFEASTYYVALTSFYVAISIGFISLVGAIPSIQPFFVFLYSLFFSIFLPNIVKEETNKHTVLMKLLAVIFIFIGSWLIVVM